MGAALVGALGASAIATADDYRHRETVKVERRGSNARGDSHRGNSFAIDLTFALFGGHSQDRDWNRNRDCDRYGDNDRRWENDRDRSRSRDRDHDRDRDRDRNRDRDRRGH